MKKLLFGLCMLVLVPFFGSAQQVARSLTAANGELVGFYEYKPADYNSNPNGKYPLIIFLHGIGERGDGAGGLANVLNAGIPHYINQGATMTFTVNGQTQSFIVLSPQLNYNYGSWQNFYVDEMLKYAKSNLHIDLNRIYLTGLSLGGGGTWKYASSSAANASQFAAIVPVCGTCEFSNLCNITSSNTAVWAFHALDDGVVGVGCTQSAVSALTSCGVAPKVTYYPSGNHYIWDQAYDMTHNVQSPLNVFEWMLTKSRNGSSTPPPPSSAPVANAGSNQTITLPTNAVTLNGAGSTGSISSYNWTQISGPSTASMSNAWGVSNTVTGLVAGNYVFRLKVTDNAGASGTADVTITVGTAVTSSYAPVAIAGNDQSITLPTNTAWLQGSSSYAPNGGSISSYAWSQVSGPAQATLTVMSSSNVQASNLQAGTYTFRLTVTGSGGTSTSDMHVTVNGGSTPPPSGGGNLPVAFAGNDQTITLPTNSAWLQGSSSYAPNGGTITNYAWSQVSGPAQATLTAMSASNVQASNLQGGTYVFRLTVTSAAGSSSDDIQITVNGGSTPPPVSGGGNLPVAIAGNDQTISLPTSTAWLQGSSSYAPNGGTITNYAWSQVSGPAQATLTAMSASNVQASNLQAGTYTFRLAVTSAAGTSTSDMHVTVNGGSTPPPSASPNAPVSIATASSQTVSSSVGHTFLYGSSSYAKNGAYISSYTWSQVSGPTTSSLGWLSTTNVDAKGLVAGTYIFKLTVTDNLGQTGTSQIQVNVN